MPPRKDVPSGTLDLLALRIIERGPIHGWGLMNRLRELTDDVFQVTPGGLFPALQRLEENGWVSGKWGVSENNRKARFYTITKAGRAQLARERDHWKAVTVAITRVLEGA
ncbi:MAG: PadR family transcriptional regulator [Vicinamibacterales bacterium]